MLEAMLSHIRSILERPAAIGVTSAGAGASWFANALNLLGEHAAAITALCAIGGLLVTVVFNVCREVRQWREHQKRMKGNE